MFREGAFQALKIIESVYIFIGIIYEKEIVFFFPFLIFVKTVENILYFTYVILMKKTICKKNLFL